MTGEFAKLTDLDLLSLIHRAEHEIQQRKEAGREQLRAEFEEKLKTLGFDLDDIFPEAAKKTRKGTAARSVDNERKTPRAKYKNPVTGETWSGRGARPPQWVKDVMNQRGWESLEQFKVCEEFLSQD